MQLILEHELVPGAYLENRLIYGGFGAILNEMELTETVINESTSNAVQTIKFRGKFQEANAINKNKRMYPFEVLDENVRRLTEAMNAGGLFGELDHPQDSIIHFREASHRVTKLWWEQNTLMGEGVILNTPCGKVLKTIINEGGRVGISSRGVGNGKVNEDGILVIGESYKLITFDAVADPSCHYAFQEKVVSSKKENYAPQQNNNFEVKNESTGIHSVNKDLLLVCLGGLIKQQTGEIKARM